MKAWFRFFHEDLDEHLLERAVLSLKTCDLCIVLGTSQQVQPIASLPSLARGDLLIGRTILGFPILCFPISAVRVFLKRRCN